MKLKSWQPWNRLVPALVSPGVFWFHFVSRQMKPAYLQVKRVIKITCSWKHEIICCTKRHTTDSKFIFVKPQSNIHPQLSNVWPNFPSFSALPGVLIPGRKQHRCWRGTQPTGHRSASGSSGEPGPHRLCRLKENGNNQCRIAYIPCTSTRRDDGSSDLPREARPSPGGRGDAPTPPLTPGAAAAPALCVWRHHCQSGAGSTRSDLLWWNCEYFARRCVEVNCRCCVYRHARRRVMYEATQMTETRQTLSPLTSSGS